MGACRGNFVPRVIQETGKEWFPTEGRMGLGWGTWLNGMGACGGTQPSGKAVCLCFALSQTSLHLMQH
jgi:hypothetical protein